MLTQAIKTAQLSPEEQAAQFKIQEEEAKNSELPSLANLLLPGRFRTAESFIQTRASLRRAIVALAAERFRLEITAASEPALASAGAG
jgi:hypothetical protein